jgi:O-antigen/teichoic acid export membrane protein
MQRGASGQEAGFGGLHAGREIPIRADHPRNSSEVIGLMTVTTADRPALSKLVLSQSAVAAAIKFATAALSYVMFVVLAWVMDPFQYGQYAVCFNLAIVLSAVSGLGATTAILRLMPQYRVQRRFELARGALVEGLVLTLCASAAIAVIIAMTPVLPMLSGYSAIAAIAASSLLVPAFTLSEYLSCVLRTNSITFWALAPRDIFWRLSVILLALAAIGLGWSVSAVACLAVTAILLIVIVIAQSALVWPTIFEGALDRSERREWYRIAAPMWVSSVLYAMTQQLDVVIAAGMTSAEDAGAYFAAQKTALLLALVPTAVGLVGAPMIASYFHGGDIEGLRRLCARMSLIMTLPALASFIGLAFVGHWLLAFFDPAFANAYGVLMILGIGALFGAATGPTGYFLQMTGRERDYLLILVVSYCLTLALQIVLGWRYGILGIAIGTTLGSIVGYVWAAILIGRTSGVDTSIMSVMGLLRK